MASCIMRLLLATFMIFGGSLATLNEFEACWEQCYQMANDDAVLHKYKPAFWEFYDMGMEARRLKNMRSVNGTAVLIDSTLSKWHDPTTNPNLQSHETAEAIFQFQLNLVTITTIMTGNDNGENPMAFVQFNEHAAWSCEEYTCLDMCEAAEIFENPDTYLTGIQLNASSHHHANIEPACRLGYLILHETSERSSCNAEIDREMAIAFINSDFHSHVHESDEWDDYSPCDEHFDTRYAIGTHAAEYHEMRDWSSRDAHPTYIKDSQYTMEAAQILRDCMVKTCCKGFAGTVLGGPFDTTDVTDTCVITTDHFGENIETMDTHPNKKP